MYHVISESQDFYGFAVVNQENLIKGYLQSRVVYSGTKKECDNFYMERIAEWADCNNLPFVLK